MVFFSQNDEGPEIAPGAFGSCVAVTLVYPFTQPPAPRWAQVKYAKKAAVSGDM
jgi:hypothetical protein